MKTLVVVEHSQQALHPAMPRLLSAALQLQQPVTVLIVGHGCQKAAQQAAILPGVHAVLLADRTCYQHQWAENVSQLVAHLATGYTHILMHASPWGRGVLPRVAALLDCPQVSEVTTILSADTVEHPIYAGHALESVRLLAVHKIFSIRSMAFSAVGEPQTPCAIVRITDEFVADKSAWVRREVPASARPGLSVASCVVAAGRGLQTAQQFQWVEQLADLLSAALGATRAAVEAGFMTREQLIGQSGQIIAPFLYIALGISGAIQHVTGMSRAKVIVAINTDADAPMMQMADYALVGELSQVLPELIQRLTQE